MAKHPVGHDRTQEPPLTDVKSPMQHMGPETKTSWGAEAAPAAQEPAPEPKEPTELEKSVGRALDKYQETHGLSGYDARGHLTRLISEEVEGGKHATKTHQT